MAEHVAQNYANHRMRSPMWLVAFFSAVIAFIIMVLFLVRQPGLVTAGTLLMSIALVATVLMVRGYATRLQDRIIRGEMQARMARLGLDGRLAQLTPKQIVALRFASDAELPALCERAIAEKLDPDQIKRAVTDWQGDYLRV